MTCKVDQWIVNSRDRFSLATNLTGYKILEDRADFSRVTSNTSLFISKMEQYLIARGNTEGALTLEDKVRKDLKLPIHDVLDTSSVEKLIDKWSRFMEDNKTLLDDKSRSQVPEIKSFLDVNLKGKISDAQGYLMGKVKQFHTTDKPNTLYVVVDKYIDFIFGAQDACRVAKSCGYQICEGPTAKRNFTSADMYATAGSTSASGHGKKGTTFKVTVPTYQKGSTTSKGSLPYHNKGIIPPATSSVTTSTSKQDETFITCTGCGNRGHDASVCERKNHRYFNSGGEAYSNSTAWRDVLKFFDNKEHLVLSTAGFPRIPNKKILAKLARFFPNKRINPDTFGGKTQYLSSYRNVCCDMCTLTHAYTNSESEDTPSLIAHNAYEYLNTVNIITKSTVLTTRALIDTGALHGSYAASRIKDHLLQYDGRVNKSSHLVCSPINDSCTLMC
jgi:hypothetical protein